MLCLMFVVAMALELQIPLVSLDLPLLWLWNLRLLCSSERVSCTSPDVVHCYFYWKLINIVLCCVWGIVSDILINLQPLGYMVNYF